MTETDINLASLYWQEERRRTKMTNSSMSLPDFRTWAENIITMARQFGTAQDEIEKALEQAFNQGNSLGYRRGKKEAWIIGE